MVNGSETLGVKKVSQLISVTKGNHSSVTTHAAWRGAEINSAWLIAHISSTLMQYA